MTQFIIERDIPGASMLTSEELAAIAAKSNDVVASLSVPYTWVRSYVAGDKFYCVHETSDMEAVWEHAQRGGFPANTVAEITAVIGPETAETATKATTTE